MKKIFGPYISELNNVTWPTQKQAIHSMIIVLTIMALTGVFLTLVDTGLKQLMFQGLNFFR